MKCLGVVGILGGFGGVRGFRGLGGLGFCWGLGLWGFRVEVVLGLGF